MSEPNLWLGECTRCGTEYQVNELDLRAEYPEVQYSLDEGAFIADCANCDATVTLERTIVKVVPFSAWTVLPPEPGVCPECAVDHDPAIPHNLQSLHYQYNFRSFQAKRGLEERWPTWADAMAHCEPEMRRQWVDALRDQGVDI